MDNSNRPEVKTCDSTRPFAAGDVVQLKSGGPPMTFREYRHDGQAYVMYSTRDGLQHGIVPAALLRFAREDTKPGEMN